MAGDASYPQVLGVYSLRKTSEIGSGTTMTDHENITYWYVRQTGEERFEVQPLATSGLPSGMVKSMYAKDFIQAYTPEPFYYSRTPVPVMESLAAKLLEGDESAAVASLEEAERTALSALMVEKIVFPGQGKPGRDEILKSLMERVRKVLGILLCRDPEVRFEHRARFNSCGVSLRKDGHLDQSLGYFSKALEIDGRDENIHFNMARVYFDKGELGECAKALELALGLNPEFKEAGRFARYIAKLGASPA
jgi:tetratricopeptide (TPR) repeat protein